MKDLKVIWISMNKYQIFEAEKNNHAGSKATGDVVTIAEELGFNKLTIILNMDDKTIFGKIKRQVNYFFDFNKIYKTIEENSFVLLQHPFHNKQLIRDSILFKLKKNKNVKYICFIHDVEKIRKALFDDYHKKEYETMKVLYDVVICHNETMMNYLVKDGFDESKIVILDVFDYLQKNVNKEMKFSKTINIAGNLDINKSSYIKELSKLNEIKFNLFGPNYDKTLDVFDNLCYQGSYDSNELSKCLDTGFGLVWDGESIDECKGNFGRYLEYNNPHKMSLYLSCNMPVIIWSKAAKASYIKDNGLGICIDSLYELNDRLNKISEVDYKIMLENVKKEGNKLRDGEYTKKAIKEAIGMINYGEN